MFTIGNVTVNGDQITVETENITTTFNCNNYWE